MSGICTLIDYFSFMSFYSFTPWQFNKNIAQAAWCNISSNTGWTGNWTGRQSFWFPSQAVSQQSWTFGRGPKNEIADTIGLKWVSFVGWQVFSGRASAGFRGMSYQSEILGQAKKMAWEIMYQIWFGNISGSPRRSWKVLVESRT